jgi:PAS domain S-box-containing protein
MGVGNLLIIEDEKRLRDNLEQLLRAEGYRVTTVADGSAGVQCLQQTHFDLVITDLKMEGLDGFGVMEHITAHSPDTPVIVITGYASTESAIAALRQGAYDYIAKPFEVELLQMAIARALEKVRLQRQLGQYTAELERHLANLRATTVSKRYVDNIIRSLADMLLVLNPDGTIRTINAAVTTLLGYSPEELLGQSLHSIWQEDAEGPPARPTHDGHSEQISQHETTFLSRDGRRLPVSLTHSPMYDDEGTLQGTVCMARDMTDYKRAEEALRASEAWLRLLTKQMPAVLWATDTQLCLTAFLGTGQAYVRPLSAQVQERRLDEFWCTDNTDFMATVAHYRALEGESVIQEVQHGERTLHAHVEPLRDDMGSIIGTIGVALDITERRWQEEERRKIAYEIHDGIAQLLVSAQQHLETFEDFWQRDPTLAQAQLEKGLDRLHRAIVEARRLMTQMHPVALETQGLVLAVQRYLEELGTDAGWEVEYQTDVTGLNLSAEAEAAVFRIIQEALTNAAKHARSSKVRVALQTAESPAPALTIVIQDWGTGFQPEVVLAEASGLGLFGMRERARTLGGTCCVHSRSGEGTSVRVWLPLRHAEGT